MRRESIGKNSPTSSGLQLRKLRRYCSGLLVLAMIASMLPVGTAFSESHDPEWVDGAVEAVYRVGADGTMQLISEETDTSILESAPELSQGVTAGSVETENLDEQSASAAEEGNIGADAMGDAGGIAEAAEAIDAFEIGETDGPAIIDELAGPADGDLPFTPLADTYDVYYFVDGALYHTESVADGGYLVLPAKPVIPGGFVSFVGWFMRPDAKDDDIPYDVTAPVTQPLTLHAIFSTRYLVQFMHGTGEVCRELSYRAEPADKVKAPAEEDLRKVTLPQDAVIEFWTEADADDPSPKPFEWELNTLGEIGHDVILRPVYYIQVYVTFITYGEEIKPAAMKAGTYLPDVFGAGLPAATGRDKYKFLYWSLDEDGVGTPFNYNTNVAASIILYAKWEPIPDSATYYIAYFLEKENLPVGYVLDPTDTGKRGDFVYVGQEELKGTPDSLVVVNKLPPTPDALDDPMRYASLISPASATISAADDTVICVYARRNVYTMTFLFEEDEHGMRIGGTLYNNANPYKLSMKYGQYLASTWPIEPFVDEFILGGNVFSGYAHDDSNLPRELWITRRVNANSDLMPKDINSPGFVATATTIPSLRAYTTRYFYEQWPGQSGGITFTVTGNGSTRAYTEDVDMRFVGPIVAAKAITGMHNDLDGSDFPVIKRFAKSFSEPGLTVDEYNLLTSSERAEYTITNYFYTRHRFNFRYMNTTLPPVEVVYGQPLHLAPAPPGYASLYVAGPPERERYEFKEWTQDPLGLLAFDWTTTMPDNDYAAFAIWTPTDVTVSFWDGKGPGAKLLGKTTAEYGGRIKNLDDIALDGGVVYRSGNYYSGYGEFICWDHIQPATDILVTFPKDAPLYDDEYNLYARWRTTGYKVVYEKGDAAYDGPLPSDPRPYEVGSTARVMDMPPGSGMMDDAGNLFIGWRVAADAAARLYYPRSTLIVDRDIVLYPVFAPSSEVVKGYFHINLPGRDETGWINFWKNYPGDYYLPNEELLGWTVPAGTWLIAWQTSPTGGTRHELADPFPVPAGVSEVHLYAVWNSTSYTVTETYMQKDKLTKLAPDADNPENPFALAVATGANYSRTAPKFHDWVAYGYEVKLGGATVDSGEHATPFPPAPLPAVTVAISNVMGDYEVYFYYKVDSNNDGIPDEDEGPFEVTEIFVSEEDGEPVGSGYNMIPFVYPNPFKYDRLIGDIKFDGWVPVSYSIDDAEPDEIPRNDGSFTPGLPIDDAFHVTFDVTKSTMVVYSYKADANNNWIPDDEEDGFAVTERHVKDAGGDVKAPVVLYNLTKYSRVLGDLRAYEDADGVGWVPVSYRIDGGEPRPLGRVEGTGSDGPVDMEQVVEFPVTKDTDVTFTYKIDSNHNDIPDEDEDYPGEDGYEVVERYHDPDGKPLKDDSEKLYFKYPDLLVYDRLVKDLRDDGALKDWVPVSYVVFGDGYDGTEQMLDRVSGPRSPVDDTKHVVIDVTANFTITYKYKLDTNHNWIPDDDEGDGAGWTVTERHVKDTDGEVKAPVILENLFRYSRVLGDLRAKDDADGVGWVPVSYSIDGGEARPLDRVEGSGSHGPVDMEQVVDFPVTKDTEVTFTYKIDSNHNDIPDEDEDYPGEDGYEVVERYHDPDGKPLKDDSEKLYFKYPDLLVYDRLVKDLRDDGALKDWVPVSYVIFGDGYDGTEQMLDRVGGPRSPVDDAKHVVIDVKANFTITYKYKLDTNHNWIPDDDEGDGTGWTVTERHVKDAGGEVKAPVIIENLFRYSRVLGDLRAYEDADGVGWVPVSYSIDGGEPRPLDHLPEKTASGWPIDMEQVVEFPVTKDTEVTFTYKIDTNHNDIPDEEEEYPGKDGYEVVERYHDPDGKPLKDDSEKLYFKYPDLLVYDRLVKDLRDDGALEDWVPVSYVVFGDGYDGTEQMLARKGGPRSAVDMDKHVTIDVTANFTITYKYKLDLNHNWIPDDDEEDGAGWTVTERHVKDTAGEVKAPVILENLFRYSRVLGELRAYEDADGVGWVPVSYSIDGGEPRPLDHLPEKTASGWPIDMEQVVEFPVTKDTEVTFTYKIDTNHNDIPDEDEEYPGEDGYEVVERYHDPDGKPLKDDSEKLYFKYPDLLVYDRLVKDLRDDGALEDWVPVSYVIFGDGYGGTEQMLDRVGGPLSAVDDTKHVVIDVTASFTITYKYKLDLNHNWIPDDDEGDGTGWTVTERHEKDAGGEVKAPVILENLFRYSRVLGDLRAYEDADGVGWVPVSYSIDGGEPRPLDHLPEKTASGWPIDMEQVVEFPVTKDTEVTFTYKIDTNHNDIPDEDEEYPHPDGYHVTERYRKADDADEAIKPDAVFSYIYPDDELVYDRAIKDAKIPGWVPVAYSIDGAEPVELKRDDGSYTPGRPIDYGFHVTFDIVADVAVTYYYKADDDDNWIPDDEEGDGTGWTVTEIHAKDAGGEVKPPYKLYGVTEYSRVLGDLRAYEDAGGVGWVPVSYSIDGGEAKPLDRVEGSGSRGPVDLEQVVEFPVTKDTEVTFIYKIDTNHNDIPDEDEEYPGENGYEVVERYHGPDGKPLKDDSEKLYFKYPDLLVYDRLVKDLRDDGDLKLWVPVSYVIDGDGYIGDVRYLDRVGGPRTAVDMDKHVTIDVTANFTITYTYKADRNENWIPDDEEGDGTGWAVTERHEKDTGGPVKAPVILENLFRYSRVLGDLRAYEDADGVGWVPVSYSIDGGEAKPLDRLLEKTPSGWPVDMEQVVEFPVTKDTQVTFIYKIDTNHNDIPDEEEEYPGKDGFEVVERYHGPDGKPLKDDSEKLYFKYPDLLVYDRLVKDLRDDGDLKLWVPVSYVVNGDGYTSDVRYLDRVDGPGTAVDMDKHVTIDVTANFTITYTYKADRNENWIPDDEEGDGTGWAVTERHEKDTGGPVKAPVVLENLFRYSRVLGDLRAKDDADGVGWVPVRYSIDGGEPRDLDRLPETARGKPVDMNQVVEFPVTKDTQVTFVYMIDTNHNDIPDIEEKYTGEDGYEVVERYHDPSGAQLKSDSEKIYFKYPDLLVYDRLVKDLRDGGALKYWVPVSYVVDGDGYTSEVRYLDRVGGSRTAVDMSKHVTIDVTANFTITYTYKADLNENWIPDDEEGDGGGWTVTEIHAKDTGGDVKPPYKIYNVAKYSRVLGDLRAYEDAGGVGWVPVRYSIDGGESKALDRLPETAVGAPVDMDQVVEFPVTKDTQITFIYEIDTNHNDIPDKEEKYPHLDGYHVTERYRKASDANEALKPDAVLSYVYPDALVYDRSIADVKIPGWVPVSYSIGGAEPDELRRDDGSYTPGRPINDKFHVTFDIVADVAVTYYYKVDDNDNWIPDDEEGSGWTVTEHHEKDTGGPVKAPVILLRLFKYSRVLGDLRAYEDADGVGWVPVRYSIDGGAPKDLDRLPETARGKPVDMSQVIEFLVTKNTQITFIYEIDTNHNDIPDKEEKYPHPDGYHVTERYRKASNVNEALKPDAVLSYIYPDALVYDRAIADVKIPGWVPVSYSIGSTPLKELQRDDGSYTPGRPIDFEFHVTFDIVADTSVTFCYKVDDNNNWIPDDEEGNGFIVTEYHVKDTGDGEVKPPYKLYGVTEYSRVLGDLRAYEDADGVGWVPVRYSIDGGAPKALDRLPETARGKPVDMSQVVEFPVTKDTQITFIYEIDTNHNDIPDKEETYPGKDGYEVVERYHGPDGKPLKEDSDKLTYKYPDPLVYDRLVKDLRDEGALKDWVPVSYVVVGDGYKSDVRYLDRVGGPGTEVAKDKHVVIDVIANFTITYTYKADKNHNWIPDDEEGDGWIVTEYHLDPDGEEVMAPVKTAKLFKYSRKVGDLRAKDEAEGHLAWVPVGYTLDGEEYELPRLDPENPYGSPVDMEHMVEFPVTENTEITFHYKRDSNGNNIPDDEEGPFVVTEHYVDIEFNQIPGCDDTTETLVWQDGIGFVYTKLIPLVKKWVEVGYRIGATGDEVMQTPNLDGTIPRITVTFAVESDMDVYFIYKVDRNENRKPDPEEDKIRVQEDYVSVVDGEKLLDTTYYVTEPEDGFQYSKDAPDIEGWVCVGFHKDGEWTAAEEDEDHVQSKVSVSFIADNADGHIVRFAYDVDEDGDLVPDKYETYKIYWEFPELPAPISNPNAGLTEYKKFSPDIYLLDPVAIGYPFLYWTEASDPTKRIYPGDVAIPKGSVGERTFAAHFGPYTEHKLTFDGNGDSEGTLHTILVPHGSVISDLAAAGPSGLVKRGYEFGGWSTRRYDPSSKTNTLAMDADKTVYAYWNGMQDGKGKTTDDPDEPGDPDNPGVPSTPMDPDKPDEGPWLVIEDPLMATVTFDGNGDTRGTLLEVEVRLHDAINLDDAGPSGLLRLGYDFGGWGTRRFDPRSLRATIQVDGDMTVYAYWKGVQDGDGKTTEDPDEPGDPENPDVPSTPMDPDDPDEGPWQVIEDPILLTLTFDGNGDEDDTMLQIDGIPKNTLLLLSAHEPKGLAKPGYDFGGWSLSRYDPSTKTTLLAMLDDTTVYAYWNGEQGGAGKITEDPDEPGDPGNPGTPSTPADPDDPGEGPWYVIEDPVTVTAWFDGNGDIAGTLVGVPVLKNAKLRMDDPRVPKGLVRYGYDFGGWSTAPNNPNKMVGEEVRITDEMSLYAYWKGEGSHGPVDPEDPDGPWTIENPIYVRVTYNGNGDRDSTIYTITVLKHQPVNVAQSAPQVSRSGYSLVAWTTVANNEGAVVATIAPDKDTTLYALWSQNSSNNTGNTGSPTTGGAAMISSEPPVDIKDPEAPSDSGLLPVFIDDHIKYINGYPDGTMRPDSPITRAETAAIIFRLLRSESKFSALENPFADVPDYEWYAQSVKYLAFTGIVEGYPDGTFRPDAAITRAEFAKMVSGYDNLKIVSGNQFSDTAGHWAEGYINCAANRGWVSGYPDGTFMPENDITRAEVVSIVNRMLQRSVAASNVPSWVIIFSDMVPSYWAYLDVIEASNAHDYTHLADGTEAWDYPSNP